MVVGAEESPPWTSPGCCKGLQKSTQNMTDSLFSMSNWGGTFAMFGRKMFPENHRKVRWNQPSTDKGHSRYSHVFQQNCRWCLGTFGENWRNSSTKNVSKPFQLLTSSCQKLFISLTLFNENVFGVTTACNIISAVEAICFVAELMKPVTNAYNYQCVRS